MPRKYIYSIVRDDPAGWDEVDSMIIIAHNVADARAIAAKNSQDEGKTVWFNKSKVTKIGYAAKGQRVKMVCTQTR